MSSDYTRAHLNQFLDRRKKEGKMPRTEPSAKELRGALARLLREAADCADEWRAAAIREWMPLAPDYHDGDGTVTADVEGPYLEHRLAMALDGRIRRDAEWLSADVDRRPLTKEAALDIANRAADAFVKNEEAHGRVVPWDSIGRNAVAHAGLLALESIEPGRWVVSAGNLDYNRMGTIFVARRGGSE